jgi:hypothetical protein
MDENDGDSNILLNLTKDTKEQVEQPNAVEDSIRKNTVDVSKTCISFNTKCWKRYGCVPCQVAYQSILYKLFLIEEETFYEKPKACQKINTSIGTKQKL